MTETLHRGTLIGVVCGVVGAAVVVVAIVIVVCLCKHGQLKRSRRTTQKGRSSSAEELQDTTSSLVRTDGNGLQRRDFQYAPLYPALSRQRSPSGDDSQVTTTTPLAPATPKPASLRHQEVPANEQYTVVPVSHPAVAVPYIIETPVRMHSRDSVFQSDSASQPSMNFTSAVQNSEPSLVACVPGQYLPYNAAVQTAQPGQTDVYYAERFGGYPSAVCYEQPNDTWYVGAPAWPNAAGTGRPWGIVPLMSADLYLMRDTSGELYVSGLNDSAVTHVDTASLEPERASTVDYQRDLDGATSGFSSLPRRTNATRGVSPTHSHARNFARSASHSLHSMTRSHTPSILEEPEPTDADGHVQVDVDGESIYVNVHVHRTGNALLSPSTSQSSRVLGADLVRTESSDGELQDADALRNIAQGRINVYEFDENSSLLRIDNDSPRSCTGYAESDKLDEASTTLRKACEMLI